MNDLVLATEQTGHSLDETIQYLTFTVLGEAMAIGILDVKEIIEVGAMTRVPMSQPCVRGVINLRGNVVPVVDLSARLGGPLSVMSRRSCIVLVQVESADEQHTMGMLVDQVNEILEIPLENIQKAPDFGTDIPSEFIDRMGRFGEEFIILLNIERLLSVAELSGTAPTVSEGGEVPALPSSV